MPVDVDSLLGSLVKVSGEGAAFRLKSPIVGYDSSRGRGKGYRAKEVRTDRSIMILQVIGVVEEDGRGINCLQCLSVHQQISHWRETKNARVFVDIGE
jgi:hypothetical protein